MKNVDRMEALFAQYREAIQNGKTETEILAIRKLIREERERTEKK
jgi:hypothetical protein